MQSPNPCPRRLRVFRFSLRTLFVVVTVFAVWLGLQCIRQRHQRLAVDRIAELRGFVAYDFEYDRDGQRIKDAAPSRWACLRILLGDDFFPHVVRVNLDRTAVSDADLECIGRLRHLTTLSLNDTSISDGGLAQVSGLRRLRYLGLARTRISDVGLREADDFGALEELILEETGVGDAGVRSLRHLRRLRTLVLSGTRVTSDGISSLSGLSNLDCFTLYDTAVDDAAITYLVNFRKLTMLGLSRSRLSGEGLADLLYQLKRAAPSCRTDWDGLDLSGELRLDAARWCQYVEYMRKMDAERGMKLIDLSGSSVSDEHLPALVALRNVQMIDLRGSRVTATGLEELKMALANCRIYP